MRERKNVLFLFLLIFIFGSTILFGTYLKEWGKPILTEKYQITFKKLFASYNSLPVDLRKKFKDRAQKLAFEYTKASYLQDRQKLENVYQKMLKLINEMKKKVSFKKEKHSKMEKFLSALAQENAEVIFDNVPILLKERLNNLVSYEFSNPILKKKVELAQLAYQKGDYSLALEIIKILEHNLKNNYKNSSRLASKDGMVKKIEF